MQMKLPDEIDQVKLEKELKELQATIEEIQQIYKWGGGWHSDTLYGVITFCAVIGLLGFAMSRRQNK